MKYADLVQPAIIPDHVMTFDPQAADCTCITMDIWMNPPNALMRKMRTDMSKQANLLEVEEALEV